MRKTPGVLPEQGFVFRTPYSHLSRYGGRIAQVFYSVKSLTDERRSAVPLPDESGSPVARFSWQRVGVSFVQDRPRDLSRR